MKIMLLGGLAIAVAATAGAAFADDNQAENRIEARFHQDTRLKADDVKVDVDNGVATLKGKVATQAERARAERLARVSGVSRVENKIEIDTGVAKDRAEDKARAEKKRVDQRADREKDRIDAQEERTKEHIDQHGKTPTHPTTAGKTDTAGDEVTDSWITTKVKSQYFGADALKGSDISVDTDHNGVVTLTGTVPNEVARARAVEMAQHTKGVRRVVDSLRLK
jgi:hyperosmotically inducible protein